MTALSARQMVKKPWQERLWNGIRLAPGNSCWEWKNVVLSNGYGAITVDKKQVYAHRMAYESAYGKIENGLCVLHRCDNPVCCRPDHLFLGTRKDNAIDKVSKGRHFLNVKKGELNPQSKLTEAQVLEIRANADSLSTYKLAKIYGVSNVVIHYVISRKTWRHI